MGAGRTVAGRCLTITFFDGLRRGGILGLAETTAGGALIGAKFGGPIGAAIGAGIGAAAGLIRLFVKGAEQKAIEKVRALYGLTIDKSLAKQIVATAKQGFGGDTDLAFRSPQVRDLLELYSMSTGQKFSGAAATPRALQLTQSGGVLYQAPTYSNGAALPSLGGMPNLLGSQAAGQTVVNITIPGAKEFFTQETVQVIADNPRTVQSSAVNGSRASVGRRETAGLVLNVPGLITS